MKLVTNIRLFRSPYTMCYVSRDSIILPDQNIYKLLGLKQETHCEGELEEAKQNILQTKSLRLVTDALFLRPFVLELKNSTAYRNNVLENLNQITGNLANTMVLHLILEPPIQEVIDFSWNERMLRLLWMRLEIENAFSWLSTLGGAYSALGDYFERCADEAAKISRQQYQLSKMLGDDSLAERSKLYLAIAFAQKGDLKNSRRITRNVCAFSILNRDKRLNRMCQGVWAKLQYIRRLRNEQNCKLPQKKSSGNGKVVSERTN